MFVDNLLATYGLDSRTIIVPYGSRVYGTHKTNSDYDYLAITPENSKVETGTEYRHGNVDITIYRVNDFKEQLADHKIHCLEAYYQGKTPFAFKVNLEKLRHSICQKASHSWVKAKKKVEVEKDYYIGWKSLFHSLRILDFGFQIATKNSIDYSHANDYWFAIRDLQTDNWAILEEIYKPIYNHLATEFRKVAPKHE